MTELEELVKTPEGMQAFQRARIELIVTELICELMERQGIDQATLAESLGLKNRSIKRMLADAQHMKLNKLSDVFHALGYSLQLKAVPLTIDITI